MATILNSVIKELKESTMRIPTAQDMQIRTRNELFSSLSDRAKEEIINLKFNDPDNIRRQYIRLPLKDIEDEQNMITKFFKLLSYDVIYNPRIEYRDGHVDESNLEISW